MIPKRNEKDLEDIPQDVLDDLKIVFVDHVDEVLKEALMFPKKKFQFPQSKFLYISKNKSEDGNGATIKN